MLFPDQAGSGLVIIQTCGLESPVVKTKLSLTQSRKLLTYSFSSGAFAALAKDFAGDEFGQKVPAQVTTTSRIKLRPFFLAENAYFIIKQQQQQL